MQIIRLSRVPSIGDYVRGLAALELDGRLHDAQRRLLQSHYAVVNRTATATQLAELANVAGGHPVVNGHYGRLGHAFCDKIAFVPDTRSDGTSRWWTVWSQGWETPDGYVWEMLPQVAEALELLGWVAIDGIAAPERETAGKGFVEGTLCRITVNAYERNKPARVACIAHYGTRCMVCDFDFGEVYGCEAEDFIHVHHLRPVSEIGQEYVVDPVADMRPVCANCHAVIHLDGECKGIEEMQQLVRAGARG